MKRKTVLKNAGVLLIITLFALTSFTVVAGTNHIETKSLNNPIANYYDGDRAHLAFDNGLDYESMASSQEGWTFASHIADDFQFNDPVEISRIKWIGGYWGEDYQTADTTWHVSFFQGWGPSPVGESVWNPSHAGPIHLYPNDIDRVLLHDTGNQIYYEMTCDFANPQSVQFNAGEDYWVCIFADIERPPDAGWGYHRTIKYNPAVWGSDSMSIPYWTPGIDVLGFDFDMAFQLFEPSSEVCCDGTLNWPDVPTGTTVTDTFRVSNCGEPGTLLDWEISEWPDWGTDWTFTPDSGMDLKPEDGWVTVVVSAVAPTRKNKEYTGTIKIINEDYPSDYCEVSVTLSTPRNQVMSTPFLNFLENHPNIFPLLRQRLGL